MMTLLKLVHGRVPKRVRSKDNPLTSDVVCMAWSELIKLGYVLKMRTPFLFDPHMALVTERQLRQEGACR